MEVVFRLVGDEAYDLMKDSPQRRSTIGTKRIQRATDKAAIIQALTSEEAGSFKEIWRVLLFAAVLGFKNSRREPLASYQSGDGIRQDSFANNSIWPGVLYLMGLVDTSGTDVLMASEEAEDLRIKIFEEYANGGLAILKDEFEKCSCSLDAIVSYLQSEAIPLGAGEPDLDISI